MSSIKEFFGTPWHLWFLAALVGLVASLFMFVNDDGWREWISFGVVAINGGWAFAIAKLATCEAWEKGWDESYQQHKSALAAAADLEFKYAEALAANKRLGAALDRVSSQLSAHSAGSGQALNSQPGGSQS